MKRLYCIDSGVNQNSQTSIENPPIIDEEGFSINRLLKGERSENRCDPTSTIISQSIKFLNVRGLKIGVIQHQQSCVGTWVATHQIFVSGSNHVSIMGHTFEHLCAMDLK